MRLRHNPAVSDELFLLPALLHLAPSQLVPVPVNIRDAVLDDTDVLADLFRCASLSNDGDREILLANPDALEFSDTAVREGRTRVAVLGSGKIVGFATTCDVAENIELEDLFVDPEWMRQGIGRELILDALAVASRNGFGQLVVIANPHAQRFYERTGFVSDGEVATRFGPGLRMLIDVSEASSP